MYSLGIGLAFFSVFCLYSATNKVEVMKIGLIHYLALRSAMAKCLSILLLMSSTWSFMTMLVSTSGIFCSITLWMLFASVFLLFMPFQKMSRFHSGIALVVLLPT